MTDPTYTLTMVLDRSGSMQSLKDGTIGGFDAFSPSRRRVHITAKLIKGSVVSEIQPTASTDAPKLAAPSSQLLLAR